VNVKWGKQQFENVEIDTDSPVELFKAQLFALTQVPPERQKIMGVKGGAMKDDADLAALGLKDGQKIMLMGSAEVLKAPEAPTVFAEDMAVDEVAALTNENPGGLTNLGNTCYLNSGLQVMKAIPEIPTALQSFVGASGNADTVTVSMRELIGELLRSNAAREVRPLKFVSTFRTAFPMFAERTENGQGFVQQDAEECWSTLVTALSQKMHVASDSSPSDLPSGSEPALLPRMQALRKNLGDMLFGVEMESTYSCIEDTAGAEPPYTTRESVRKISCHISEKTAHLYTALELNLEEMVEKNSAILGREAQYSKKSKIARLPPYLAVQFVRFAWRKDTNKRAKILRQVSFPAILDMRNLCTSELQAAIAAHCTALEDERDAKAGLTKAAAPAPAPEAAAASSGAEGSSSSDAAPMDIADGAPKSAEELAALKETAKGAEANDNCTGRYELFAIITHQGRTAEGGHYVGWVKKNAKKWLVFDDETVAEIDAERVKELYGGGDWHTAYMTFYRKMDGLELEEDKPTDKLELKQIETKGFSMEGASKKSAN